MISNSWLLDQCASPTAHNTVSISLRRNSGKRLDWDRSVPSQNLSWVLTVCGRNRFDARLVELEGRVLKGRLQVGDYGQACSVVNANTAKVVFNKTSTDADLLPFFFRMEVPTLRDEGLFLIEKSRKTSPKTAFTQLLRSRFAKDFEDYTLTIDPVLPAKVFKEYLDKGKVQKITFIKMGIPDDIADLLDGGHDQEGKTELVITAPRHHYIPFKKSILSSDDPRKSIQDLYELKDLEYENIKVVVKLGSNSRTIDLGSKHATPLYEITEKVQMDNGGIGTYASMANAFESLASDINEGAYASA
jgi:hypothetical protein